MTSAVEIHTRQAALLQLLNEDGRELEFDDIDLHQHDDTRFLVVLKEWMVLTEREADELWDEQLDQYIDDCIIPELPEAYKQYFDCEKWKRDARFDGRGQTLSGYDGCEHEIFVSATPNTEAAYFLAYRVN